MELVEVVHSFSNTRGAEGGSKSSGGSGSGGHLPKFGARGIKTTTLPVRTLRTVRTLLEVDEGVADDEWALVIRVRPEVEHVYLAGRALREEGPVLAKACLSVGSRCHNIAPLTN